MQTVYAKFFEQTTRQDAPLAVSDDSLLIAFVRSDAQDSQPRAGQLAKQTVVVKPTARTTPMCEISADGFVDMLAFSDDGLLLVGIIWKSAAANPYGIAPERQTAAVVVWTSLTGELVHSFELENAGSRSDRRSMKPRITVVLRR